MSYLTNCPQWLLNLILKPESSPLNKEDKALPSGTTTGTITLIPEGKRNSSLYKFARSIEKQVKGNPTLLEGMLKVFNQEKMETPLPDKEIAEVIQSITTHTNIIPFTPLTVDAWIDIVDPPEQWIVPNYVPDEMLSLLVAPPKAGKSTLARALSVAVAKGEYEFLGQPVRQRKVLYLALEESPRNVRSSFRKLGVTKSDPLLIHFGSLPTTVSSVYDYLEKEKPGLVIIDTIGRIREKVLEINDYGGTADWLEIWMNAAHDLEIAIIGVFHFNKAGRHATGYEGLFSILGSTAIAATVDHIIQVGRKNDEDTRTIETISRISDYAPNVYTMDQDTERLNLLGTVEEIHTGRIKESILEVLPIAPEDAISFKEIEIEGRKQVKTKAMKELVADGIVERSGKGLSNSPFYYRRF